MKSLLMFIGGLTIGAGVSWIYHKNKYENMIQDEIESLREHYQGKEEKHMTKEEFESYIDENEEECSEFDEENERREVEYEEMTSRYQSSEENDMVEKYKKPFVVTPEDFASVPGFDTDTFYYYANDIIANGDHKIVEDVEYILGMPVSDVFDQFGTNLGDEDSVYIRNMRLKCDFEVLRNEEEFVKRNGD